MFNISLETLEIRKIDDPSESHERFALDDPNKSYGYFAQEMFNGGGFYDPRLEWDGGYSVYAAISDLAFIGAINLRTAPNPGREWGYISKVMVRAKHRNKGFGSALIKHAIHTATEADCPAIAIQPQDSNNERLYERLGFTYDTLRDPDRLKMFLDLG